MKRNSLRVVFVLVTSIALLAAPAVFAGKPQKFNVVIVQPIWAVSGWAADVDSSGNIVGYLTDATNQDSAFYYDRLDDTVYTLAEGTFANGMNDSGAVVGVNTNSQTATTTACYWSSPTAPVQNLSSLAGGNAGAADISNNGIIVGGSFDDAVHSAVVWSVAGGVPSLPLRLPPLAGDDMAIAYAVSDLTDAGFVWVAGRSHPDLDTRFDGRAVRWAVWVDGNGDLHSSAAEDLGTLAGGVSVAYGVNVEGDTCGVSEYFFPFLKLDGINMMELDVPRRAIDAEATDINQAGATVGRVTFKSNLYLFDDRAWLWLDDKSIDLNARAQLGGDDKLEVATAVSDSGYITGQGAFSGQNLPFVMMPQ